MYQGFQLICSDVLLLYQNIEKTHVFFEALFLMEKVHKKTHVFALYFHIVGNYPALFNICVYHVIVTSYRIKIQWYILVRYMALKFIFHSILTKKQLLKKTPSQRCFKKKRVFGVFSGGMRIIMGGRYQSLLWTLREFRKKIAEKREKNTQKTFF